MAVILTNARDGRLDALAAILPEQRAVNLARILTDDDVATLRHLAHQGMGENTLRALSSDLGYLQAWCQASIGSPLPWPAPESLILKFISHHLWDSSEKERNPDHGMPDSVDSALRKASLLKTIGPHAPSTVQRRLASWATLHRWNNVDAEFGSQAIRTAMRMATRASHHQRSRKSKRAIVSDVLERMIATCQSDKLIDIRDRALLYTALASGGRRRSEVAGLRFGQLTEEDPVRSDEDDPASRLLPCLSIRLGRTKTTNENDGFQVFMVGKPVLALQCWLDEASINSGAVFRPIDRWGNVGKHAMSGQAINDVVKRRAALSGLDPALFSAHGLRSGFITESARRGVPLIEVMPQSGHRSVSTVVGYYNEATGSARRSARLFE